MTGHSKQDAGSRWRNAAGWCVPVGLITVAMVFIALALQSSSVMGQEARGRVAPEAASGVREKAKATARKYMVSAANPYAVDAGVEILEAGGSAVDAAIATQLVLNLVEPQSSGIGGGAFVLHYDAATRGVTTYDGRETAPAAAQPDRFLRTGKPRGY